MKWRGLYHGDRYRPLPTVMQVTRMIVDALRQWVEEYHVDGFRFDLASVLTRAEDGTPLADPPLIRAISKDPVLSQVKLIAEPWDCGGLYQVRGAGGAGGARRAGVAPGRSQGGATGAHPPTGPWPGGR